MSSRLLFGLISVASTIGLLMCCSLESKAEEISDKEIVSNAQNSIWHGFSRLNFMFQSDSGVTCSAHIVKPKEALNGNPWVFRARFPEWHPEMDSILLDRGFHIAYINTDNMYGSGTALDIWDSFYNYLVDEFKLDCKVTLEGVSRGGLFVYSWAKRHPDRVNSIYAESPVCNILSWPGGFYRGVGSSSDWSKLKEQYGIDSDKEAMLAAVSPIDSLDVLASYGVPIMHVVGLNDSVVPYSENSKVLINRYIELGGVATVVTCTKGEQSCRGHHFPIQNPEVGAKFIIDNSNLKKPLLKSSDYYQLRGNLKNSYIRFEREKFGRVAFLGGSITYNRGWRDSICSYLQRRFPDTEFEFIAAGIPSMGTTPGAFRMDRDILSKGRVDLLFEEAAVNDASNGRTDSEQKLAMEGIVRHALLSNPAMDIVMMQFVDPSKMASYRAGDEPAVITNHESVAKYYNISTINLAKEVTDRIDSGEFSWENDFKNLHPSPFGQAIYSRSMLSLLDRGYSIHLDSDDKITASVIPDRLSESCYDSGILEEATSAVGGSVKLKKGWIIEKSWKPTDGTGSRANYRDVPMLISETPGALLSYTFEGSVVGIAVAAGQDAGMIEYRVDKGEWITKDLFTRWSRSLHLPWYYTLATGLSEGKHKLEIRLLDSKNRSSSGTVCRVRYFYYNEI